MLRETEERLQAYQKERITLQTKQIKQKQELELLTMRDEVLLKDKNTSKIQLRRFQNSFKDMLEQIKMNISVDGLESFENLGEVVSTTVKFFEANGGLELANNLQQGELDLKLKL